jgi:hypothetical protein
MADVAKLRELIEAYGIAVRCGLVTPCLEDENEFRARLGLPAAPARVVDDWNSTDGVRKPVTLQRRLEATEPAANQKDEAESQETSPDEI